MGCGIRDDRGKNFQTMVILDIKPIERIKILESIRLEDFSHGPISEVLYGGSEMWIFGKNFKEYELYIKITMGIIGSPVICISFHIAEHKLYYPFKTT